MHYTVGRTKNQGWNLALAQFSLPVVHILDFMYGPVVSFISLKLPGNSDIITVSLDEVTGCLFDKS